jgi:hypothetical protein
MASFILRSNAARPLTIRRGIGGRTCSESTFKLLRLARIVAILGRVLAHAETGDTLLDPRARHQASRVDAAE